MCSFYKLHIALFTISTNKYKEVIGLSFFFATFASYNI